MTYKKKLGIAIGSGAAYAAIICYVVWLTIHTIENATGTGIVQIPIALVGCYVVVVNSLKFYRQILIDLDLGTTF